MAYDGPVAERRYEQRLRAEGAADTRRCILEAVYSRLREAPSQPVALEVVAREAGVARSTIYVSFGSRAGLFDALAADLRERAGFSRLLDAVQGTDARETLRGAIRAGVEIYAAQRDLHRTLYSMASLDDEAGAPTRRMERDRGQGMALLARGLRDQGALHPDVSFDEAVDVLWLLTSFDAFDLFYTGRSLPVEEVTRRLIASADRILRR